MSRHAVTRRTVVMMVLSAGALSIIAACGSSVRTKVTDAMVGCMAVRNPLFKAGKAEQALATRLPASIDSIASETAYRFGFTAYQEVAEAAETQAELTCALELGARYQHDDVRQWLQKYSRSPDLPVAQHAKRLHDQQVARIDRPAAAAP